MTETRERSAGDRARTPLLELVTRESLDLDYQEVASRRAKPGPVNGPTPHRGAAVAVGVFGLLVAVAAVQNSRNADVDKASRDALVERIEVRKDAVSSIQDRIVELRATNERLVDRVVDLVATTENVDEARQDLALGAGFVAVEGPGLRVTVDDQPQGDPDGLVRATDLRVLVNGLWQAGAEAIAINGRRLTSLSAIVNSSIAIQVNKGPLSPPYVVEAIGGQNLDADFVETGSGLTFLALAEQFGFVVERDTVSSLLVPAAPAAMQRLRFAERPSANGPGDQGDSNP
ncbi:DUF881 domain-containing protein [Nocardioides dilutus]